MVRVILHLIATATLLCCALQATAQFYFYNNSYYEPVITWEAGASAGGMNCLTDLGGKAGTGKKFIKDVNWNNMRPCGGWYLEGVYHSVIGARLEVSFGQVTAGDSILKNKPSPAYGRYLRNLSFRSDITEASLVAVFYPLVLFRKNGESLPMVLPYLLAGAGYFTFNPQAFINNTWISLPPLHTEGQGFASYPGRQPYRLVQFNLPVGIGITCEASTLLHFRAEIIYRKLWTDYLDDVSKTYIDPSVFYLNLPPATATLAARLANRRLHQSDYTLHAGDRRGNPGNNDAYFSFNLKLALVLGRQKFR